MGKLAFTFSFIFLLISYKVPAQLRLTASGDTTASPFSLRVLPQNFYNQHLSFTCKKEVQLQKLTRLPIFIRLGSKEQVDYLEMKPNTLFTGNKQ